MSPPPNPASDAARSAVQLVVRSGRRAALREALTRLFRFAEAGGVPVSWALVTAARDLPAVCAAAAVAGIDCAREKQWTPCPECRERAPGSPPCCGGAIAGASWAEGIAETVSRLAPFRPACAVTYALREVGAKGRGVRDQRALLAELVRRFGDAPTVTDVAREAGPRPAVACLLLAGGAPAEVPREWVRAAREAAERAVSGAVGRAGPPAAEVVLGRAAKAPPPRPDTFPLREEAPAPARKKAPRDLAPPEERVVTVSKEDYAAAHPDHTRFSVQRRDD